MEIYKCTIQQVKDQPLTCWILHLYIFIFQSFYAGNNDKYTHAWKHIQLKYA